MRGRAHGGSPFRDVVCAVDRSSQGYAVCHQATLLADIEGTVRCIASRREPATLLDRCQGADLLVLGAGGNAAAVLEQASIAVLLVRWCPLGAEVTDHLLVVVDGSAGAERAAQIAGRLAAGRGGKVTVLSTPQTSSSLRRACAATERIVLAATGVAPHVVADHASPPHAIPSAAAALDASLLVVTVGSTEAARRGAAVIARSVECSVLGVPEGPAG